MKATIFKTTTFEIHQVKEEEKIKFLKDFLKDSLVEIIQIDPFSAKCKVLTINSEGETTKKDIWVSLPAKIVDLH